MMRLAIGFGLSLTFLTTPLFAQIVPSNENVIKTVQVAGQFSNAPESLITVYTVPAGKVFRITDLIFTNYSSTPCDLTLSGMTYEIRVQPSSTWSMNLASGPAYTAGQKVNLDSTWRLPGHGDGCTPIYTIMGYLYNYATGAN